MINAPKKRILKQKKRCKRLITALIVATQLLTASILFAEAPPETFTPAENWEAYDYFNLRSHRNQLYFYDAEKCGVEAGYHQEGLSGEDRVMKSMREFLSPTHLFLRPFWKSTEI